MYFYISLLLLWFLLCTYAFHWCTFILVYIVIMLCYRRSRSYISCVYFMCIFTCFQRACGSILKCSKLTKYRQSRHYTGIKEWQEVLKTVSATWCEIRIYMIFPVRDKQTKTKHYKNQIASSTVTIFVDSGSVVLFTSLQVRGKSTFWTGP